MDFIKGWGRHQSTMSLRSRNSLNSWRSFGQYFWFLQTSLSEDVEAVARDFIAKWTLAETEHEKKVAEGKYRDPRPGDEFNGDGKPCNLETMINELKIKEYDESVHSRT